MGNINLNKDNSVKRKTEKDNSNKTNWKRTMRKNNKSGKLISGKEEFPRGIQERNNMKKGNTGKEHSEKRQF